MNMQFTSLRRNLGGKTMKVVLAASLALAAITAVWHPTAEGTDSPVGPQPGTSAGAFRSRPQVVEDYRIYLVGSQEQTERLRFVLSELGADQGAQPISWGYEIVVLESAEEERQLERNLSDLNDSRIALGYNEIWVVDWRGL